MYKAFKAGEVYQRHLTYTSLIPHLNPPDLILIPLEINEIQGCGSEVWSEV